MTGLVFEQPHSGCCVDSGGRGQCWGQKQGDQFGGYYNSRRAMQAAWIRLTVEEVVKGVRFWTHFGGKVQSGLLHVGNEKGGVGDGP